MKAMPHNLVVYLLQYFFIYSKLFVVCSLCCFFSHLVLVMWHVRLLWRILQLAKASMQVAPATALRCCKVQLKIGPAIGAVVQQCGKISVLALVRGVSSSPCCCSWFLCRQFTWPSCSPPVPISHFKTTWPGAIWAQISSPPFCPSTSSTPGWMAPTSVFSPNCTRQNTKFSANSLQP